MNFDRDGAVRVVRTIPLHNIGESDTQHALTGFSLVYSNQLARSADAHLDQSET